MKRPAAPLPAPPDERDRRPPHRAPTPGALVGYYTIHVRLPLAPAAAHLGPDDATVLLAGPPAAAARRLAGRAAIWPRPPRPTRLGSASPPHSIDRAK